MEKCKQCGHITSPLCPVCKKWKGDPTAVLQMVGQLEASHGSSPGSTIHELFMMGDIPPKKKGKTQSANTVKLLQKYAQVMSELKELEELANQVTSSRKGRPEFLPEMESFLDRAGDGIVHAKKWWRRVKNLPKRILDHKAEIPQRLKAAAEFVSSTLPLLALAMLFVSSRGDVAAFTGHLIGSSMYGGVLGLAKAFFYTAVGLGMHLGDGCLWVAEEGIPAVGDTTAQLTDSELAGNLTTTSLKVGVLIAAPLVWIYG